MKHVFVLCFLAAPAFAEEPLSGKDFEKFTAGKTLLFGTKDEAPYGMETYLKGRRVIWSFLDGRCEPGYWYEEKGAICFSYEFEPEPQCWSFFEEDDGLLAIFMNEPYTIALYEVQDSPEGLVCNDLAS